MDQNMRTVNTKSVSLDSGTENTRNLSQDTGTGNSRNVSQDTETGNLRNLSQDTGTGNSRNVSQDTATVISRNVSKDTAAVISRNVSQDTAAVISRNVSQDTAAVISRNVSQDSGTVDTRNVSQDTETGNLINMSQDTGIMDLRNIYQDTGTRNTKNMFQNTGPRNTINMSQDKETENTKSVSQGAETVKTNVIQDSEIVETRRVLQRKGGGNTINMSHTTRNMVQKTKCTIQSKTNMDKDVNKISITPETRETGQETENVNRKIKFLSKERIDAVGQMESATQDTELMNQAKGSTYQRTGTYGSPPPIAVPSPPGTQEMPEKRRGYSSVVQCLASSTYQCDLSKHSVWERRIVIWLGAHRCYVFQHNFMSYYIGPAKILRPPNLPGNIGVESSAQGNFLTGCFISEEVTVQFNAMRSPCHTVAGDSSLKTWSHAPRRPGNHHWWYSPDSCFLALWREHGQEHRKMSYHESRLHIFGMEQIMAPQKISDQHEP
uniref:Uncharacterized protein n=1 Tax=Timema genevievae TaxID=629358 RepID=A0A7R9K092_TIMGE|nr:unnamed protein product [Timema genevievae]